MSKALSLKLQDDIFNESEHLIKKIKIPRNTYINRALAFYNRYNYRRLLKGQLRKESALAWPSSAQVLREIEEMEDDLIE